MTATKETVVEKVKEIEDLCNVPSIASNLKLSVNLVKQFFPVDAADSVITGESDGNFVVQLRRSHSIQDEEQLILPPASIWSRHGYQKLPQEPLAVSELNSRYLLLLDDRPSPVISSDTTARKLGQSSAAPDFKTEKKASSSEFFGSKTASTNGTASKKSPIKRELPTLFQKKQKTEDVKGPKADGKVNGGAVKRETPSAEPETKIADKPVKKDVKNEPIGSEVPDSKALKNEPAGKSKSPKADSTKKTKSPKAESTKSTKSTEEMNTPKAASGRKGSKAEKPTPAEENTAEKSLTENKRKRLEDTSDDEEVARNSRGKKKKLKRVAILDSDSDDENETKEETVENAEDDCMDTSESPVKTAKKSRKKTEKATPDQKTNGSSNSKKNQKKTSPLKAFTTKEKEKEATSGSEKTTDVQNGKANGQQRRRRRVLKEVTHTFKSEDGFLETKTVKEMVSETDSESEEGPASKNKATAKPVSVASTPAPRGQASLLTFFKKK